jgi:hypothetical protein
MEIRLTSDFEIQREESADSDHGARQRVCRVTHTGSLRTLLPSRAPSLALCAELPVRNPCCATAIDWPRHRRSCCMQREFILLETRHKIAHRMRGMCRRHLSAARSVPGIRAHRTDHRCMIALVRLAAFLHGPHLALVSHIHTLFWLS